MNKIFRTVYLYGNKEILLTTTRSLRAENNKVTIDKSRLRNELLLYKNLKDKGFASITTALAPLILANQDIEVAVSEAINLFQLIRRNVTQHNRIGITLLCHLVWNAENFEEEFSTFTMLGAAKEDEIEFQKQKINIILGKKTIIETILENLGELEQELNEVLLHQILSAETVETTEEELLKIEKYFLKLCNFEINPPELKSNFSMQNIEAIPAGQKGKDPLIGEFTVLSKDENQIVIESKRGELHLLSIALGNQASSVQEKVSNQTSPVQAEERSNHYRTHHEKESATPYKKENVMVTKEVLIHNFGIDTLPQTWKNIIMEELDKDYFHQLLLQVDTAYKSETIYPNQEKVFDALRKVDYKDVKAVILGQDPYHGPRQANGMCFSVGKDIPAPPSLQNIFKELAQEYGTKRTDVDLSDWAAQGVLLLNAVLTVSAGNAGSHANRGWEQFTDRIIGELNKRQDPLVFLLWGSYAIKKAQNVDKNRHLVLTSPHPSPLSAHRGFLGNNHFIQTNQYLKQHQIEEIKWI